MEFCNAILNRRVITFTYDGLERVVYPAAYGTHVTTGGLKLRGYQVDGSTSYGDLPEWRLFSLEKIADLQVLNDTFNAAPPGYIAGDRHLDVICEL